MKTWKIPVTWEMYGVVEIEAETIEDAMDIAINDPTVELPSDGYYVEDSFALSYDDPEIVRELYN